MLTRIRLTKKAARASHVAQVRRAKQIIADAAAELAAGPLATSAEVRGQVEQARERQRARLLGSGAGCNAEMTVAQVRRHVALDEGCAALLRGAYEAGRLSARGHQRVGSAGCRGSSGSGPSSCSTGATIVSSPAVPYACGR